MTNLLVHTTYEDGTECYETSEHKIQTPGNHRKERVQHSQHGEILNQESHIYLVVFNCIL